MNDMELSLDDIIKKKLKKKNVFRGRNNAGSSKKPLNKISDLNNRVSKKQNIKGITNNNSRANAIRGKGSQPGVGDARLKIIQKQRQKMTDAREKLGQIAKQTDARLKLVQLRERQRGNVTSGKVPTFRLGHSILRRTIQSRVNNSYFDEESMDYTDDTSYFDRNFADAAVSSDDIYSYFYRNRPDESVLHRTIENEIPPNRLTEQEKSIYTWTKPAPLSNELDIPAVRSGSRTSSVNWTEFKGNTFTWDSDNRPIIITKKVKPQETVGILKRSTLGSVNVEPTVKILKESPPPSKSKGPIRTLSERFCQEDNVTAQKISLLKAKLEASQKNIKNTLDTQPVLGHRIVVSNLVPSVTHEDVKELFEDIGELISSKVVRPGTAEVIYKFHKDAVKAVDVYHNRQLDGQPMKCLLLNKSVSPALKSPQDGGKIGKQVVEVDMTAVRKALHKKSAS